MLVVDEKNGITLTRGDTAVLELELKDGEGNDYDYSSDVVKFGVKRNAHDLECVLEKTVEDGKVSLAPQDTASMEFGDYLYSVRLYHTTEAEQEGEEDTVDVYTPIASARFTLGFDIIKDIDAPVVEESTDAVGQ